jgi:hypothetical protein
MTLRPIDGRSGALLLDALRTAESQLTNARGGGGGPDKQMTSYISWATEQARILSQFLIADVVNRLVLTQSFYALLDNSTGSYPRGFPLLEGEMRARLTDLQTEIGRLDAALGRWSSGPPLVVLDTNVYIHAPSTSRRSTSPAF